MGFEDLALLKQIPEGDRLKQIVFEKTEIVKTLGLGWDPKEDYFVYAISDLSNTEEFTKRQMLSFIAKQTNAIHVVDIIVSPKPANGSPAKCELRSFIRFLYAKNNSPVEIHRQLVEVYGEKCMDIKNVRKWCREFNEGRINVHDEQRSGRQSLPESTVARIDEMVRANRRITLEEIEDGLNEDCSHFYVHKIVSETLGYRKVSARWVDKWLKEAAGEWYNTGITKLVDRMKKVIEHQGDYVEK
ncbi:hypothetical protein LAZ67_17001708 [Cordylochernes scorpioides]|uniref:Mos1 transposase HTH domain-containing protein n=1 Tax=Cordylochernes scorpioides TaxID=51811 RepID=A0ABY6LDL2_9ARAC|nr:hypothetical protein LAZ67_17001708 [Cordylochernes scorpioides]